MAAEPLAHGREHLLGKGVVLARADAGIERGGEHLGRHRLLDGRLHGPAALAGVLDVARVSRQDHTFAEKVLSAMRKGFGGHLEPGKTG